MSPFIKETIGTTEFKFSLLDLAVILIFGFVFFFLLSRFPRGSNFIIRLFLIFAVFSGAQIVFFSFLPENFATLASLALAVLFISLRRIAVYNFAMIFGIAGIGAIFGLSIKPLTAVIILIVLSFYDIIAVYWTKHMIKMAEGMIKMRNIFGLVIPEKASDFGASMDQARPGDNFMILGSGDVIMPLILAGSVVPQSIFSAFLIGVFSVGGMVLTHLLFINQKIRRPMAALPPIAVMAILGYLLANLI